MPSKQFDTNIKPKFVAPQGWTVALYHADFTQNCYLAHLVQVDHMRFVSLIGDYSCLLEQARLSPEIHFAAITADGDEIMGNGSLSILGRLKDFKSESSIYCNSLAVLRDSQVFLVADPVVVELTLHTIREWQPQSADLAWRT